MDNYTELMEMKAYEAANEDYPKEKILEVAGMFRTFAVSLDSFIKAHGYQGDMDDIAGKVDFIKGAFERAGIPSMPRSIRECYTKGKRISRTTAFQICFAFGLGRDETDDFFRRIMLSKSFDCHVMEEAVYYFCIRNRMDYREAIKLLGDLPQGNVPNVTKSKIVFNGDILFTSTIMKDLERIKTANELLAYFRRNVEKFGYNHVGATEQLQKLWRDIREKKNGLADLEKVKIQKCDIKMNSYRSVSEILRQILGLDEVDEENKPLYVLKSDRSIKPLLKNTDCRSIPWSREWKKMTATILNVS